MVITSFQLLCHASELLGRQIKVIHIRFSTQRKGFAKVWHRIFEVVQVHFGMQMMVSKTIYN